MKDAPAVGGRFAAVLAAFAADSREAVLAGHMFANAVPEDLAAYSTDNLVQLVRSAADFLRQRKPGRAKVRVVNPEMTIAARGSVSIVEMANDDMPFLVDSSLGLITDRGHDIRLVLHPIFSVKRTAAGALEEVATERREGDGFIRESYIHIHIGQLPAASERDALCRELVEVLDDVRTAVLDWRPMETRLREAIAAYHKSPPPVPVEELTEAVAFLDWLLDHHFTFLGMREYAFAGGGAGEGELRAVEGTGLGILRRPDTHVLRRGAAMVSMTPEIRAFLLQPAPLIITKSDALATVHRRSPMDYIGIKRFDPQGELVGELRMVGLFTSTAYTQSPRAIPVIRRKISRVLDSSGFNPESHSGKGLLNVLESFPRDELFQIDTDALAEIALGILRLEERPRLRLFVRRDKFDRFVSAFAFIPRDRFNTDVRVRVGNRLAAAFAGTVASYAPYFGEMPLVRVHYIITRHPDTRPEPDMASLEREVAEIVRTWDDRLADAIAASFAAESVHRLDKTYRGAFSLAYQDRFPPAAAIYDIRQIEALDDNAVAVDFYRSPGDKPHQCRLKLYRVGQAIPLSGRLPILENMGLRAVEESTFAATPARDGEARPVFIHEVLLESDDRTATDIKAEAANLASCFLAVWTGEAENDGFNGLVLKARLGWREAALLRACGRYLRQVGMPYSAEYIAATLVKHPAVAGKLIELFDARFNPAHWVSDGVPVSKVYRKPKERAIVKDIVALLNDVPSLDEDRIVRRFLNLIRSTMRTNYYQPGPDGGHAPSIAFKIESASIEELPEPKPYAEIFVYSPMVEGVHLRGGKIARGGIRWSDRPEDFRTEILGLAKAQNVKNAVIVPVGAKGGFVHKRLPTGSARDEIMAEGIKAYRLLVSSLLDLTDNIIDGKVVPPPEVVRHDGPDPYLVVAADKGTATFSDIANAISAEHGFWLDDAFASGGSAGYDHKKMGITARGGWEAVKRHFREMDIDIQTTPFTVMGVGDMSGDVFGNAMLLSDRIRLLAAFDHRDVFIDPDPDPAISFSERKRLFELPRSSWQDYDKKLISRGGGVFSRQLKAIPLSAEMRVMTGLKGETAMPAQVMNALLKLKVDLIWFGGIGTYVRATNETNAEVGDRANDALRITAAELGAKVIGEGANLGLTQRARIEFARRGSRINTDAVDNSAGVNSSDMEVNIKIALGAAEATGRLDRARRNRLLAEMTDEVARLVLRNNYLQTLCLTLAEARAAQELGYDARLMRELEAKGVLDRKLEALPDETALAELAAAGAGLTRPELAVLMAYAKIVLFDQLLDSPVPDDPYLGKELFRYFPERMAKAFAMEVSNHKLRREIIATMLANSMINRGGPSFVSRLVEETGHGVAEVASAYAMARDTFDFVALNASVDALDNRVRGAVQAGMYLALQRLLRRATVWFLRNCAFGQGLEALVAHYGKGVKRLEKCLLDVLPEPALARVRERHQGYLKEGVPEGLAAVFSGLGYLGRAPDIVLVAGEARQPIDAVAKAFFQAGIDLRVDRLINQAGHIEAADFYERLAVNRTVDGILQSHRAIVARAIAARGAKGDGWSRWLSDNEAATARARRIIDELLGEKSFGLSKLSIAASQLDELVAQT